MGLEAFSKQTIHPCHLLQQEAAGSDKKSPSQKSSSKAGEEEERQTSAPPAALPGDGSPSLTLDLDEQSQKSAKTGVSQKTEKSEDSAKKKEKKAKTPEEPFVVGEFPGLCSLRCDATPVRLRPKVFLVCLPVLIVMLDCA